MRRTYKIIPFIILGLIFSNIALAEPTVENVILSPSEPEPMSVISFTASINTDIILSVYLLIEECNEEICFLQSNNSMTNVGGTDYAGDVSLTHEDATYIKYQFNIETPDGWYKTEKTRVELKVTSDGGNDGDDNNNNGTPGFEVVTLMTSIFIALFLITRKRDK